MPRKWWDLGLTKLNIWKMSLELINILVTIISSGQVFERVFEPTIESVARGGTASLFCYGYTGNVSWNQNFKKLKTELVI